jgi:nicotinamidase-related amidase
MITAIDEKTALILIDLQKGIVKGDKAHPVEDVLKNAALLIRTFRQHNLPVIIVNVNPTLRKTAPTRADEPMMPKSPLVNGLAKIALPFTGFDDIVAEIGSQEGDIFITKCNWSAFFDTQLHQILQQNNVSGIVLGGISTSIGVEGTARNAAELGYNISFASDAMTDRVLEAHERSLKYIFTRIGEVGTTAEIIETLNNRA